VTREVWTEVERALQNDERPPIWLELFFDVEEHLPLGDLRRATVDVASACEIFMNEKVLNALPQRVTKSVRKHLQVKNIDTLCNMFEEVLTSSGATQFAYCARR